MAPSSVEKTAMTAEQELRESERRIGEIERRMEKLTEDLEAQQKRLRDECGLLKTLSLPPDFHPGPHVPGLG
jgi:hypothetical protein